MKKLILLFISFLFLFANSLAPHTIYWVTQDSVGAFKPYIPYFFSKDPPVLESYMRSNPNGYFDMLSGVQYVNHYLYVINWYYSYNPSPSVNLACVENNGKVYPVYNVTTHSFSLSSDKVYSVSPFCLNHPGYFYVSNGNYWAPDPSKSSASSPQSPICPNGEKWDSKTQKCVAIPPCKLVCTNAGQVLDRANCVCKCPPPLVTSGDSCAPNPNLNKAACEKEGGIYLDSISPSQLFSDPEYAYLVMQVPLFTSHLCYTKNYINTAMDKIKNALSPKKVVLGALSILPIGKLKYVFKGEDLLNGIEKVAKSPKTLQDNKPIIDTKYNPNTGTYEPVVNLKPRTQPLPLPDLLRAPADSASADNLVGMGGNLKDFLHSPFATKDLSTSEDLTDAAIDYSIDNNLRAGTQTKIGDDLRDIFNRSKSQQESNFPMVIKDDVGDGQLIDAEVKRDITPLPQTGSNTKTINNYKVTYYITPQGASKPTVITYNVKQQPAPSPKAAPKIIVTPSYSIGETPYVGKEIVIKSNADPVTPNTTATKSATAAKAKPTPTPHPNYNSFVTPAENAITNAFNYKINLFTCPNVTPKCPNSIVIDYNVMHVTGQFKIPDPMCAVITAIDNPKISPVITTAANLIVLFAGIMGALTLFRRD